MHILLLCLIIQFYFTEVKHLKQLVRNVVDPNRNLGHVDRDQNGKKSGSTMDQSPASMSAGQSSTEKTKESTQRYYRTAFPTNIFKTSKDGQERTVPIQADAAAARPAASEANGNLERRTKQSSGGGEACEDCKQKIDTSE